MSLAMNTRLITESHEDDESGEGTADVSETSDSRSSSDFDNTESNDMSNRKLIQDESGEFMLHSRTQKQMREISNRLSRKEQESFDQDAVQSYDNY